MFRDTIKDKIQEIDDKYMLASIFFEKSVISKYKYLIIFIKIKNNRMYKNSFMASDSKKWILKTLDEIISNGFGDKMKRVDM